MLVANAVMDTDQPTLQIGAARARDGATFPELLDRYRRRTRSKSKQTAYRNLDSDPDAPEAAVGLDW